jgi:protein translocase SecG subunit
MEIVKIIQLIVAILLIIVILMQNRGGGLSGLFGGGGNIYMAKRGAEKFLFIATIILTILFFITSLIPVVL